MLILMLRRGSITGEVWILMRMTLVNIFLYLNAENDWEDFDSVSFLFTMNIELEHPINLITIMLDYAMVESPEEA